VENNKLYNLLLKGWFRTKGRSSRQEYILKILMMFLIGGISEIFLYIKVNILIIGFIVAPIGILSVIQIFFVTHRRLHDLNASGWWQLITFIPFGQILMIGFIFFKGTQGSNKYGEEPKY
jgi:uncharacterized membrane protein YhaH (DUF805 family)